MTAPHSSTAPELLTISIVTFLSDASELRATLASLQEALAQLNEPNVLITLVDNSPQSDAGKIAREELSRWPVRVLEGHGNIGFGRAHNLAFERIGEFHLILNPDIQMQPDALKTAISFMRKNPDTGLLTPKAYWPDGTRQFLCKRYPALFDLLLRGFAPPFMRALFERRLARYEMRAETNEEAYWSPPIVSGCFMMFRGALLQKLEGFDPRYFLYFEDFDLSLRSGAAARTAYVPSVEITHAGGHAARKGWWHIRQFGKSAALFYRQHGLKLF